MRLPEAIRLRLLAAAWLLCAAAPAATAHPLRIGYVFAMANAPVLIASHEGYFTAQGLQVELTPFPDGPAVQRAVAAGDIDVAYIGAPPVYQWFARGLDERILAKVNYGQAALVVRGGEPVDSLAGLRGRRIAEPARGSGMDVLLRGVVLQDAPQLHPGRDLSLVQMPVGNMNLAIDSGVVDGAFEWEPFVSQEVLRGSGRVVFDVDRAFPGYPWYVIAATTETIGRRSGDLLKLLRANHAAIAFLDHHAHESDRIIAEAFRLQPIRSAADQTVTPVEIVAAARQRLGWSDRLSASDIAFIQRLMSYSYRMGLLPRPLEASDVVDTSLWKRAVAARN